MFDLFNADSFARQWNQCDTKPVKELHRNEMLAQIIKCVIDWDVPNSIAAHRLGIDQIRLFELQTGQSHKFSDYAVKHMWELTKAYG